MSEAQLPIASILLITLTLLACPLLNCMFQKPAPEYIKTTVKVAFLVSLIPLCLHLHLGQESSAASWTWIKSGKFSSTLSFSFDFYALTFIPIALFVTWAVLEFALWYMAAEKTITTFFIYLLVFLLAMLILVTSNSMFQLFIGWEGVGMMSFLLIGWWHSRADANTAAVQAVIYNRTADIALLFALGWSALSVGTWQIDEIIDFTKGMAPTCLLIAIIIGAMGKSAQFFMHPWLPAAMEGPTPVSSLLHSSTMVVAGIFLLIRFGPLLGTSPLALSICLWVGAITTLFAAACALNQNDLKKIIAFSTSSQLGLMMVTIGLNQPQLAFFHICTHAFFKAMLFLCAGSVIHCLNNEQDIRKMGGMFRLAPYTSACLTLGSLAITGTPFLTGFFSKDPIIEAATSSYSNAFALAVTLLATTFTAVYSLRVVFYVVMGHPRMNSLSPINENSPYLMNALKRLAWGSIGAGFFLASYILPGKTPVMTMPPEMKLTAVIITISGLILALGVAYFSSKQFKPTSNTTYHRFLNMLVYFSPVMHRALPKMSFTLGQKANQAIDQTWLEKVGPKAVASSTKPMSSSTSNIQRGMLFSYLGMFLLATVMAIAMGFQP